MEAPKLPFGFSQSLYALNIIIYIVHVCVYMYVRNIKYRPCQASDLVGYENRTNSYAEQYELLILCFRVCVDGRHFYMYYVHFLNMTACRRVERINAE